MISIKTKPQVAANVVRLILELPKTIKVDPFFVWQLITLDPDDNKYVDAAISGNAEYLVSDDSHFRILKTVPFPKVTLLTSDEFLNMRVENQ